MVIVVLNYFWVNLFHLVRNGHEEGPQFLNIKLAGVPEEEAPSKHFDDWDPIS